jgi:hypothetical protein
MKTTLGLKSNELDYSEFIKKLVLPPDFTMPRELVYEDIRLYTLTRTDAKDDVAGINSSLEIIRKTRGGDWPGEPMTMDFTLVYDTWHELEFEEGYSFTYVIRDADGSYLGCCYFSPMGRRTPLTKDLLTYDVDVSWWVTTSGYEQGYYAKMYKALSYWLAGTLPFKQPYYSNKEIPS